MGPNYSVVKVYGPLFVGSLVTKGYRRAFYIHYHSLKSLVALPEKLQQDLWLALQPTLYSFCEIICK